MTTQQTDALQCAADLEYSIPRHRIQDAFILAAYKALKMVRTQHARIADLEAQLEAIGTGGVSGPLIGQPQAMPDLSQLTERGAKAWAGVDAQGLREGFTAADMATVSAQGFRDGVASLSANAGEPRNAIDRDALIDAIAQGLHGTWHCTRVWEAWHVGTMSQDDFEPVDESETPTEIADAVLALLAAPPTAQAGGWTRLPGALPEPGTPVLLDIGKKYPIRAMWAAKHTVQAADDDTDWGEYVEADDMYYAPEGWYEWNQCEDNHWRVTETPRAWMPLPPTSAEGVEHG